MGADLEDGVIEVFLGLGSTVKIDEIVAILPDPMIIPYFAFIIKDLGIETTAQIAKREPDPDFFIHRISVILQCNMLFKLDNTTRRLM